MFYHIHIDKYPLHRLSQTDISHDLVKNLDIVRDEMFLHTLVGVPAANNNPELPVLQNLFQKKDKIRLLHFHKDAHKIHRTLFPHHRRTLFSKYDIRFLYNIRLAL